MQWSDSGKISSDSFAIEGIDFASTPGHFARQPKIFFSCDWADLRGTRMRTRSNCSATSYRSSGVGSSRLDTELTLKKQRVQLGLICARLPLQSGPITAKFSLNPRQLVVNVLEHPYTDDSRRQRKSTLNYKIFLRIRHLGNIYQHRAKPTCLSGKNFLPQA